MTREETKTVLATMSAVYPKNLLPDITELTVNVWYQLLQDVPYRTASAAVMGWMQTNKYPPTPANIRELVTPESSQPAEIAWGAISKAARKFGYTDPKGAEQFLGPDLWAFISNLGWLYYCRVPVDQEATYYAQFRNAYEADRRRSTERARLSPAVVKALEGGRLAIGGGE